MVYTRNYVGYVPGGSHGPDEYLAHKKYDTMITTRDCVLSLSDYPDNRLYIPTEKLIADNFGRIIDVTEIEPMKVFNNKEQDERLTFEIIKNILLMTQDRHIMYDTTGRWWNQFATIWRMYSELSRQHLIQIYKGIYRDSDGTSDLNHSRNGSEGFNTSDAENHTWGWNISESQNTSFQKSANSSNNTSSSHNVGMNKGVFAIYDQWVRSYRDMTGGMYYQMTRAGLWSTFVR